MSTNDRDLAALTYLAGRLRTETYGCGPWDQRGIEVKVAEFRNQNLAIVLEQILRHATDPDAKTPGALHRKFSPPMPSDREPTKRGNPRRDQECPKHPGQWPDNCAGCKLGDLPGYGDADREPLAHQPAHADASLARAFMAQNKPNLCGCGVRRDLCPAHREAAVAEEEA